jgi:hypothetical protein
MNFLRKRQTVQLYAASANAPMIIDRPSTATKGPPFRDKAIAIVHSAIDGAAPNKPANLFGRKASPNAAKRKTATPPAINRKRYSSRNFPSVDIPEENAYAGITVQAAKRMTRPVGTMRR